ncbi:Ig-like domain-containing protein [Stenotrophomonas chelatiphaga]|uniref:Ig-like domain-containing protein n=1 Tax=Stenotrophomonas chelatiphaga TaxID=517011 RepID=UPI0028986F17|nr:Ig-like domain-containing protein [Stenotrophomonas chelatiphaga]
MAMVDQHGTRRTARHAHTGWGACLLALLMPATLLAQTYPSPLSNTANVAPPADIGDIAPGNNSATDSNVLALQAQLSVSKSILGPTTVAAGGQVQYQIQVGNQGPSSALGVTVSDAVPALLANVSWTCTPASSLSSCAVANGTGNSINALVNVGVGDSVSVVVTATAPAATPATIPANTAALILPPGTTDPTPGDNSASTPAITVQPAALLAVADSFAAALPATGGTTPSVLTNDTLAGVAVVAADLIVTLQNAPTGFSIDANGVISVPSGAPAGRNALTYQICERISPSNCSTATATFAVAPSAVNDSYSVAASTPSYAQTVATNDNATATSVFSLLGAPPAGLTFNADGSFVLAPAGGITAPVSFQYQVCLPAPDATACATATASILVNANPLVAVDDVVAAPFAPGTGGSTPSVIGNDSLGGQPISVPATVQLSLVGAPAGYSIAPNGVITVAPTAAAGAVDLTYQVCETAVPANCATANVSLVVSPDAANDSVTTPGAGQAVGGSVAGNDNAPSGALFSVPTQPTRGTVVMDASGAFTYTPTGGNTGADTFAYQVCLPAPNATVCDTATVSVQVAANTIDALDDIVSTALPSSGGTTPSVLANDLLNGVLVTPAQVVVSLQGAPGAYSIATNGQITVAAGAAAGAQTLDYQLCEAAVPTNCDLASVQLVIAPDAVGDTFTATAGVPLPGVLTTGDNAPAGSTYSLLVGPANGTATVDADGGFSYTALAAYTGQDSFQYQLCLPAPNAAVCDTATATFNVAAAVVAANDDDFSAAPFGAAGGLTAAVTANDTVNGVPVVPAQVTLALTGAAPVGFTLQPTGELSVPAGAQAGIVTLTYQLCEAGTSNCDAATITVVITPDAVDDVLSTNAGRAVSGNVAINDNAPAGSTFSVQGTAPVGLVFSADGAFTYTPPALFTGAATFDYQVCLPAPETAVCATATVTINVNAGTLQANDDDFRSLVLDANAGGTTNSVLANDTHNGAIPPDPSEVVLSLVGAPSGYVVNPNGTISVPGGAAAGQVEFNYQMCEVALPGNCSSAAVLLLLSPVANNDNFSTQVGVPLANSVAGNDNVPAGSAFEVSGTAPAGLVFNPDGSFVYTPPVGTQGAVTFAYEVCLPAPNTLVCTTATVTLNVNAGTLVANDDDFRATPVDPTLGGSTASVLGNDSLDGSTPPASTAVQLSLLNAPAGYTLAADGTLSVAAGAMAGAVTLTYQLCEAALPSNCDSAQIYLLVAPQAQADVFSTPAGQLLAGNVGTNDNAPIGAVYTVNGTAPDGLSFSPDGSFLFSPTDGFTGPVSFSYQVCLPAPDTGLCSTAAATINVNAGNLIALADDFSGAPLAPGGVTTVSVLANDTLNGVSPPAAASVSVSLVGAPSGYALTADGLLQVPASATAGVNVLTYQLCESAASGNCASAQVTVVVTPQAQDDALSTPAGQVLNGSVGDNDNAPMGSQFSVTGTTPDGLLFNGNGTFSYTPPAGVPSPVGFSYQVCLPAPYAALCSTANVSVNINAGTLLAVDDDFTATPINPVSGGSTTSVLANDALSGVSPPDPASVLLSLPAAPAGFSITSDGVISIAAGTQAGAVSLTYQLCEAALPSNCDTASVALLVSPQAVADAVSTQVGQPVSGNVGSNDNIAPSSTFVLTSAGPAGLEFNADGSFTYTPPLGVVSPVTFDYQVCLPAPNGGICSIATVTLNVNNGALVAADDDFSGTALPPGGVTTSVLVNDSLDTVSPPAPADVVLSLVGAPAGYAIAGDGTISLPTGTATGRVQLTYQLCEAAAPTNCDTATVSLLLTPQPADDIASTPAGQAVSGAVGINDNVPAGSAYTLVGAAPGGLVFNPDGSFTYTPPAGVISPVTFDYQVCLPAPDATVCGTASVTINVNNGALSALGDDFSATPLLPGGTTAGSVLANDTLNNTTPPAAASVVLSLVGAPAGYVINADGTLTTPTGAVAGAVNLTYQVCEAAAPTNCDTAPVSLVLTPVPGADAFTVLAGQSVLGNVGGNDNVPAGAVFSVIGTAPAGLTFNADGSFSYTPPVAAPSPVSFDYQVCLPAPNAGVCGIATVTLTVNNGALLAADDDFSGAPLPGGATTAGSVLANDALNGVSPPAAADVTLRLVGAPAGYGINADGTISTPLVTPSGAVTLVYELCEAAAPGNCATANVALVLVPQPVADVVSTLAGQLVGGNVGSNDNLPAGALFSVVGTAPTGLVFNADGSFTFTPPAGVVSPVSFSYQVCLPAPNSTVCGTAAVTINVNNGALEAVADDFSGTALLPGGSTPSVLVNDVLNGATPPAAAAVQLSLVGAPAGYAINADGTISIPSGTLSGALTLTYQLCEVAAPGNCDSADVSLLLTPVPQDDVVSTSAGQAVAGSVGGNDNVPVGAVFSLLGTPPAGLLFNADGSFSYNPPVGVASPVQFDYQVCLPAPDAAVCGTASVTVNVNNGALTALADDFTATPLLAGASTPSVLLNDTLNTVTPPAAGTVNLSLVGAPVGYLINAAGVISTPIGAQSGAVTLTYQLCEAAAPTNCDTATVSLVLQPQPVADTVSVAVGQAVNGNVGSNDNVPAGAVFSVVGSTPAGLLFNPDGSFSYSPPVGVVGPVSVDYQVCLPAPNAAVCGNASVTFNVNTGTLAAADDDFSGTPLVPGGSTPSVLANDALNGTTPPLASDVLLSLVGAPAGYAINADGTISTLGSTPSGAVTLTYQLCEAAAPTNCDTASVALLVTPVPVADVVSTLAGQPLSGNVGGNDNVPSGALFSVVGTPPAGLLFNADGSFSYTPPAGVASPVTFSYQVCLPAPNGTTCGIATVTINVNNGALSAVDDDFSSIAVVPGGTTPSVLANDTLNGTTPPAAAAVALSLVGAPAGYAINPDGTLSVPTGTLSGVVTLTYQICEVAAPSNCDSAAITLLVSPAPANDVVSTPAGQPVVGEVGSNDNVPAGALFSVLGAPPTGLVFNADGSFSYTPPLGTNGSVSIGYQVCLPAPNGSVCGNAILVINVNNGALAAVADDFSGTPLLPGSTTASSVLANDTLNGATPPAPGTVTLSLVGAPAGYAINADGTIVTGSASGAVTLTYQVCEVAAPTNCDTATVSLVLQPQPLADSVSVAAGQTVTGNVGSNDNVPTGSSFSVQGATPAGLSFNADGSFSYTPPLGTVGPVSFSYQVCLPAPNGSVCGTASVTVSVGSGSLLAGNDDFSATPLLPGGTTPSVLANDALNGVSPPASSTIVLSLVGAPSGFVINPDGSIATPATAASGPVLLTYQICEAAAPGNCTTASVSLLLAPVAVADVVSTLAGQPVSGNVGSNDNVPPGSLFSVVGTPPAGLLFNADGSFTYTPPVGTTGAVAFSYQVCLPAPNGTVCSTASVTLNVNNGTLVATADDFSGTAVVPGGPTPSVLANDTLNGATPPAAAAVSLSLVGAPAGYVINADGTISVPGGTLSGPVTLTYQICEVAAPGNCDSATVTLVVSPAPVSDVVSTPAGQPVAGNVGSNDNVPVGSLFSVLGTAPAGLVFNADGSFTYSPPLGTTGAVTFTYQVCLPAPNAAVCGTASVTINVNNGALAALADDFSATPLLPGATTAASVLANDTLNGASPPAAGSVTLSLVGAPAGYAINPDGTVITPAGTLSGAVTLTYQVCEVAAPANCDTATVSLLLTPVPVADSLAVAAGQTLGGTVGGNDNVPAGSTFSVVGTPPAGLSFNADGSFSYTPPAGTSGPVGFTYQVCLPAPNGSVCGTASVTFNVGIGSLVAGNDDFSNAPFAPGGSTPSVLANDALNGVTPPPAASVVLSLVGAPAGFVINPDGSIATAAGTLSGAVTLTYQVCEAAAPTNCTTASVALVLSPVAVADVVSTPVGQPVSGNVGSNDNVPPGSSFSVVGSTPAGLVLNADGSFSYTPPAGVSGPVGFTYQVCLPAPYASTCATASVTVNVNTGTLLAADDDFSGAPVLPGGPTPSVLANDALNGVSPPAASSVVLTLVSAPAGFAINADGTLVVPSGGISGPVTLTYQVCEAAAPGNCASAAITLVLTPVPVADVVSTPAGQPVSGNVGSNDNLPPGSTFSVVGSTPPGLVFNTDGSFTYTPPVGTSGQVGFTYQVCLPAPNGAVCATAAVTLNVNNGALSALADDFSATPLLPGSTTPSVLDNDTLNGATPPASGTVVLSLVGAPAGYAINANGTIVIPAGTPSGAVTLTYQVCEAAAPTNCDSAQVSLLLTPAPAADSVSAAAGQTTSGNVGNNDNVPPGSIYSVVGGTPAGLVFNPDGSFSYTPPAGASGTISFTYQVCLPAPNAAVCGTATVNMTVATNVVLAVNDDFTATPVDPSVGGTIARSVLENDTWNGSAPPPVGSVTATLVGSTPGYTMNNQGQLMVAPGVQPGQVQLSYQLCENGVPGNCSTAIISVLVQGPVGALLAVDDSGGPLPAGQAAPNLLNVFSNDTFNSAPLDPAQVDFAPVNTAELSFAADGALSVAGGLSPGSYSTTYTLCLVGQPTVCDTGTVTVTVVASVDRVVAQDDAINMPQNGVVEIDVLGNDRMDGNPIDPDGVVLTITSPPPFGTAEVMARARIRFAVLANFAGQQSFDYQVCEAADPTLCASATVSVTVAENVLVLSDDAITTETSGPLVIDVLANDSTRTAALDPASLQVVVAPTRGSVQCANGRCTYTPSGGFFGTDSFRYRICDVSIPTPVCAEANVSVTVAGEQATLRLTKTAAKRSAQIGDLVRYTVTIDNVGEVDANGATLLDTLPPGFSFVSGGFSVSDADNAARTSGVQPLRIDGIDIAVGESATVVYYLRVGAGTGTGVHTNRITAIDGQNRSIGNIASADVDISADPLLDESLVVGTVFDDRNGNGVQEPGERGIPGVRVAAVEGLLMETDAFGRYHLVGIQGGGARGRNFILKVDPSTLPSGARFTTPNPLVRRITPGLPVRFDFGVVMPAGEIVAPADAPRGAAIELGEGLFERDSAGLAEGTAAVLDKAAQALTARNGGRLLLATDEARQALALQRAASLRAALAGRLRPDVAAATRIDVVRNGDEQVLHSLRIDDPPAVPPVTGGEGR